MVAFRFVPTAWGLFSYVAGRHGLLATFLPDTRPDRICREILRRYPEAVDEGICLARFERLVRAYFEGRRVDFKVDVDSRGWTPFQKSVLRACRRVTYGQTATYRDLACAVQKPFAARAVGGVMSRNPLPLVIPCHRILRSDGTLGGFSAPGGDGCKRRLLALEARA